MQISVRLKVALNILHFFLCVLSHIIIICIVRYAIAEIYNNKPWTGLWIFQ